MVWIAIWTSLGLDRGVGGGLEAHILYFRHRGAAVRSRALALRADFNDNSVDKRELGVGICMCM